MTLKTGRRQLHDCFLSSFHTLSLLSSRFPSPTPVTHFQPWPPSYFNPTHSGVYQSTIIAVINANHKLLLVLMLMIFHLIICLKFKLQHYYFASTWLWQNLIAEQSTFKRIHFRQKKLPLLIIRLSSYT